jgi:tetratricopeptide (TPR) repeat protein
MKNQPGADPWLVELAAGELAIKRAWDARGTGFADSVTEEGWKTFAAQLAAAREHLTKAWRLHPEYPEAASRMITVVMGESESHGDTEGLWFDRAVAAQFDYLPAYTAFVNALLPQWGGSLEAMYAFGLECLNTKRFDTGVPEVFLNVIWQMSECEGVGDIWRAPGVYQNLRALSEGELARPDLSKALATAVKSRQAAIAWRCGAYEDARKALDELGDQLDPTAFVTSFKTPLDRAKSEVYAATGPLAAQIKRAEALYQEGETAKALPLFEEAAKKNTDSRAGAYLQGRLAAVRADAGLAGKQWVEVTPKEGLAGWEVIQGKWEVESDGAVVVRHGGVSSFEFLLCSSAVPNDFEIRGELEFPPGSRQGTAGIGFGWRTRPDRLSGGFVIYSSNATAQLVPTWSVKLDRRAVELKPRNAFDVQVWKSHVMAYVNGQLVVQGDKSPNDRNPFLGTQVALYSQHAQGVRFRNLQIRGLTGPPPGPPSEPKAPPEAGPGAPAVKDSGAA